MQVLLGHPSLKNIEQLEATELPSSGSLDMQEASRGK